MQNKSILERLSEIYSNSQELMRASFDTTYPSSGNIAVFAQSTQEFEHLKDMVASMVLPATNPNQKYFELKKEIKLSHLELDDIFTHIYIRKYDPSYYGKYFGRY